MHVPRRGFLIVIVAVVVVEFRKEVRGGCHFVSISINIFIPSEQFPGEHGDGMTSGSEAVLPDD